MSVENLTFDKLNQADNATDWNNTFAYWLLVLHDPRSPYALDADEAQTLMSFQYDVEEQAREVADVASDTDLIPSVFVPVAPVTLARRWSPFPAAIHALGSPAHIHTHQGAVLAVFAPRSAFDNSGTSPDEQHFDFLLRETCARASVAHALVLLIGSPGWAYDYEDDLATRPHEQQLMREFGFVYTLRKPALP